MILAASQTIFALSTAPGRAGVAVVRVSGPQAPASIESLTRRGLPEARRGVLRILHDPATGALIDRALVLRFEAPASYTGEDMAEYHVHGGRAVVDALIASLSTMAGVRIAEPGEFTRRAFENGKLDLTEAEAVADLIDAETQAQRIQALEQLGGALRGLYHDWTGRLTHLLAHAEAEIDFPDEDLPEGIDARLAPEIAGLLKELRAHLDDNRRGERLRDGLQVAVIGAPNAGKSSIVNLIAQRDVAIVSDIPGTTRDVLDVHLDLGGYPVLLADTAGLRPAQVNESGHDAIESEGIRRALRRAENADIRLLVLDASRLPALDGHTLSLIDAHAIVAFNKCDLHPGPLPEIEGRPVVKLAARTGEGIDDLLRALLVQAEKLVGAREAPALTRQRHRAALEECAASLSRAGTARLPELMAEDIRLALRAIGRVTGRVDVEDLLDVIFRDFCIGK